jgi:hypothetical protein
MIKKGHPSYEDSLSIRQSMTIVENMQYTTLDTICEALDVEQMVQKSLAKCFKISGTVSFDEKGVVNVKGDCESISKIPRIPVHFGEVTGSFNCGGAGLKSLKGCPHTVGQDFICYDNELTSLEGGPNKVIAAYICNNNKLSNLIGAARAAHYFSCKNNLLTSLIGGPDIVGGQFDCSENPTLTSLEGAPSKALQIHVPYNKDLPLLRLLNYKMVSFEANKKLVRSNELDYPRRIIGKHLGEGNLRARILACQRELIDAGFVGNASW